MKYILFFIGVLGAVSSFGVFPEGEPEDTGEQVRKRAKLLAPAAMVSASGESQDADDEWEESDDDDEEVIGYRVRKSGSRGQVPERDKNARRRRKRIATTTASSSMTSSSSSSSSSLSSSSTASAPAPSSSSSSAVPSEDPYAFARKVGATKGSVKFQNRKDPQYELLNSKVKNTRQSIKRREEKGDPKGEIPTLIENLQEAIRKRSEYVEEKKRQREQNYSQTPRAVCGREERKKPKNKERGAMHNIKRSINDYLKTLDAQIGIYERASEFHKPAGVVKRIGELLRLLEENKQNFDTKWKEYKDTYGKELVRYSSGYEKLVTQGEAILEDWEETYARK